MSRRLSAPPRTTAPVVASVKVILIVPYVFPVFQHEGQEFIYMIEGKVGYRYANKVYPLEPGDSLFFDAEAPHGPQELTQLPAKFISDRTS